MRFARQLALLSTLILSGGAAAAPCHDVVGTWDFELSCVGVTPPPFFGPRTLTGVVTHQDGCVFAGTLGGYPWVGALAGDGNRTVASDYGSAKATGELSARRGGVFTQMTFTYTFSGAASVPTACTGVATRG